MTEPQSTPPAIPTPIPLPVGSLLPQRREPFRRFAWVGITALLAAIVVATLVYQGLRSEMAAQYQATRDELQAIRGELRQIREALESDVGGEGSEESPTPAQNTVRFNFSGFPIQGNTRATLVMVEFTDFQCPYCARYHATTYATLKKSYVDTQRLRYVAVDFPLDFHPLAFKAAEAAHCGEQQGQYWPFYDRLFQSAGRLEPENLLKIAQGMGLNMASFKACLDGGTTADRVRKGLSQGTSLGIDGTPTFIIGRAEGSVVRGRMIVGAYPTQVFEDLIQSHLALK